jgi:metal-responsive CopG/Arc/MetJ family transcriptional regulator
MRKITVKLPDDLIAEFNAVVKRRQTTQRRALEIALRDWMHPRVLQVPVKKSNKTKNWVDSLEDWGRSFAGMVK